jgi:hypothetical protein
VKVILAVCILSLASLSSSCKKYGLNGDKEILVGEWEWVRSEIAYLGSSGSPHTADPLSEGYDAQLEFAKRNKLTFLKGGLEENKGRIKFLLFEDFSANSGISWSGTFSHKSGGSEEEYDVYFLVGNDDVMYLRGFPIKDDASISVKDNVFRRK